MRGTGGRKVSGDAISFTLSCCRHAGDKSSEETEESVSKQYVSIIYIYIYNTQRAHTRAHTALIYLCL